MANVENASRGFERSKDSRPDHNRGSGKDIGKDPRKDGGEDGGRDTRDW